MLSLSYCRWEDNISGGRSAQHAVNTSNSSNPTTSNTRRSGGGGGRGRGRGRGRSRSGSGGRRVHENEMTFVSATGEPISGRCFVCGDPSHFANVCPNRGR